MSTFSKQLRAASPERWSFDVTETAPNTSPQSTREADRNRRKAQISSFIGTTVEFYDFLLYGTASALVFPQLFFPGTDPLMGTLASFGTLAVGYFARPLGGAIFGHFGDRVGRKTMLMITLFMMGAVSFLMGLMPTYGTIGVWAPILLITLRLIQGIAVGGEWAGAALLSMEHAKPKSKGFAGSIVASGGPMGAVLATLVFTPFSMLPEASFLSWGWRIPFLLSAVLIVIGFIMRRNVTETPEFKAAQERAKENPPQQIPIVAVFFKNFPQVMSGILGGFAPLFMQSILATFFLTYAVNIGGYDRPSALWLITIANAIHIFTIPAFAILSDRVGRKPVMVAGAVLGMIMIYPMFWLIGLHSNWALLLAFIIGNPLVQGMMYGPLAAWIGEKFDAEVRYTGVAVTYQLSTTIGAGLAPLVATSLLAAAGGTNPTYVIWLFIALCVISGGAYFFSRDSSKQEAEHPGSDVVEATDPDLREIASISV